MSINPTNMSFIKYSRKHNFCNHLIEHKQTTLFQAELVWWTNRYGPVATAPLARLTGKPKGAVTLGAKLLQHQGLLRTNRKGQICVTHQATQFLQRFV